MALSLPYLDSALSRGPTAPDPRMANAPRPRSALSMSMTDLVRSTMDLPTSRHGRGLPALNAADAAAPADTGPWERAQRGNEMLPDPRNDATGQALRRSGSMPGSFRLAAASPANDGLPTLPAPSPSRLRRQSTRSFALLGGFRAGGSRRGQGTGAGGRPDTTRPAGPSVKPHFSSTGNEGGKRAQQRAIRGPALRADPALSPKARERQATSALPHELVQNASYRSFLTSDRWTSFVSDYSDGGGAGGGGGGRGTGPRSALSSRSGSRGRGSAGRDLLAALPSPQQALVGEATRVARREVVRLALVHGAEHPTTAAAAERLALLLGVGGDAREADSVERDLAGYVAQRADVAPDRASLRREAEAARSALEVEEQEARQAVEKVDPNLQYLLATMNGYAKVTKLLLRWAHRLIARNDSAEVAALNRRAYAAFFHSWRQWQAQSSHEGHILPQWQAHWRGRQPTESEGGTQPAHAALYDMGDLNAAVDAMLGSTDQDAATRRVLDGCLSSLRAYPRGPDLAGSVTLRVTAPGGRVVMGEGVAVAYVWRNSAHEGRPHLGGDWIGLFARAPRGGSDNAEEGEEEEAREKENEGEKASRAVVAVSPRTLIAWRPVPDRRDTGRVVFAAAPAWAGPFTVQYFMQRKWIPRGEPAHGVCEPARVALRVKPTQRCGFPFSVGFELRSEALHSPRDWIAIVPRRGHAPPGWGGGPVARTPVPPGANSGVVHFSCGPTFPGQYTVQYRLGAWHDAVAAATGPVAFAMEEEQGSLLAQQGAGAVRVCVITDDATCPEEANAVDDTVRPRVERAIEREFGLPCAVIHLRTSSLAKDPTLLEDAVQELHTCAPFVFPVLGPDPPTAAATPLPESVLAVAPWMAPYSEKVCPGVSLLELACVEAFSMPHRATGTANSAARLLRIVRPHRSRHLLGVAATRARPAHAAVEAVAATLAPSITQPPAAVAEADFGAAAADCLIACVRSAWVRRAVLPKPGAPPHTAFADAWADVVRESAPVFRLDAAARRMLDDISAALARNDLSITLSRPLALHGGPGSGRTSLARRVFVALMRRQQATAPRAGQRPPWGEPISASWETEAGARSGGDGKPRRFVILHVAASAMLGTDTPRALATVILGLLADQGISASEWLSPEALREASRRPRAARAVTVLSLLASSLARSSTVVSLIVDDADTLAVTAAAESAFALAWLPREPTANFRALLVCHTDGAIHDVAAANGWPTFLVPTPAAADQAALVARWSDHIGTRAKQRLGAFRQSLLRGAALTEGERLGGGGEGSGEGKGAKHEGKEKEKEEGGEELRPCRSHASLRLLIHLGVELGRDSPTFAALLRRRDATEQDLVVRWLQDARLKFPPLITVLRALLLARDGLSEPEMLAVLYCVHGTQPPERWAGKAGRAAVSAGQPFTARDLPVLWCRYRQLAMGTLTFAAQGVHRVCAHARPALTAALAAAGTGPGASKGMSDASLRRAIITAFRPKLTLPRGSLEVPHQLFVLGQPGSGAPQSGSGSGGKSPHTELCDLAASLGFASLMQRRHPGVVPRLVRRVGGEKEVVNAMAANLEGQCGIRCPMDLARRYRKLMLPGPAAQNSIDPAVFRERGVWPRWAHVRAAVTPAPQARATFSASRARPTSWALRQQRWRITTRRSRWRSRSRVRWPAPFTPLRNPLTACPRVALQTPSRSPPGPRWPCPRAWRWRTWRCGL